MLWARAANLTFVTLAAVGCGRFGIKVHEAQAGAGGDRSAEDGSAPDAGGADLDAAVSDAGQSGSSAGRPAAGGGGGARAGATARGGAGGMSGMDAGLDAAVACDLTGTWAGRLDINVSWPGSSLAAGSGVVSIWEKIQLTQSGMTVQVSMLPCDIQMPNYSVNPAVANETYALQFPALLFDHVPAYLPTTVVDTTLSSTAPGSTLSIPQLALLLGTSLTSPTTGSWPAVGSVMSVDNEQDGKPCASANFRSGGAYTLPRLDVAGSARAEAAYVAARARFACATTLSNCDSATGTASVESVDTHLVGCRVAGSGADCNTTQRDFIDSARPAYTPSSATFRLARVSAGASCADARATLP